MWTVTHPDIAAATAFTTCISRIRDAGLRQRLQSVTQIIVDAANEYDALAELRSLHQVPATNNVGGVVTGDEMIAVYEQRMAAKRCVGRAIYDQIKLLPKDDRCPYCDQRNIATLDHLLPKALYPALAVTPINLIGACTECNKLKLSAAPEHAEDVFLHPYFDDITEDPWLRANVVPESPCAIVFGVHPPPNWDNLTAARATNQFQLLELGSLYSSEAARELANIRFNLQRHFNAGGPAAVRTELLFQWESRLANRLNSWQTAMYEAISHDEWFYSGGFA
jgi:hypothetical protein